MRREVVANCVLICAILIIIIEILMLTEIIRGYTNTIVCMGIVVGGCLVYLSDIIRKGKK